MEKQIAIPIKDGKDVKHLFIQINLKKNTTLVFSSFSPWENLAFIMEALAVTAQKCIQDGISKSDVYGAIKRYFMQVLGNYEVIEGSKFKTTSDRKNESEDNLKNVRRSSGRITSSIYTNLPLCYHKLDI